MVFFLYKQILRPLEYERCYNHIKSRHSSFNFIDLKAKRVITILIKVLDIQPMRFILPPQLLSLQSIHPNQCKSKVTHTVRSVFMTSVFMRTNIHTLSSLPKSVLCGWEQTLLRVFC